MFTWITYSYIGILGWFNSRRKKCVNQDAAANVEAEAENQEAERHEDENQEAERREDGSPSTYLNLDQDAELIGSFFFQLSRLYISVDIIHIFKFCYWLWAAGSSKCQWVDLTTKP